MPLPSLQQLLAFEAAFEPAWRQYLIAAPIGVNVYLEFSDEEKTEPFIEVRLDGMKPAGDHQKATGTGQRAPFNDIWEGTLITRIVTSRGQNSDQQPGLIGWIRILAFQSPLAFDSNDLLPNHRIYRLAALDSPRSIDAENMLDITELHYHIVLGINSGYATILT